VIRGVRITFQNEQLTTTVTTNNVGVYEADLPLGRLHDDSAGCSGPQDLPPTGLSRHVANHPDPELTLLVGNPCGDMIMVNSSGEPITDEQWTVAQRQRAATERCRSEELIPIPSGDGFPLQLSIRYGSRTAVGDAYSYTGEKTRQYQTPVFVAYNLFSLQADKVTYFAQKQTIEASGNVNVVNEWGATQRADSVTFKLENGQATPLSKTTTQLTKPGDHTH
jgi:hypothetical protein